MDYENDYFENDYLTCYEPVLRPSCYTESLFEQYEPLAANDEEYGDMDLDYENLYPAIA